MNIKIDITPDMTLEEVEAAKEAAVAARKLRIETYARRYVMTLPHYDAALALVVARAMNAIEGCMGIGGADYNVRDAFLDLLVDWPTAWVRPGERLRPADVQNHLLAVIAGYDVSA